jgi:hypothetical protein
VVIIEKYYVNMIVKYLSGALQFQVKRLMRGDIGMNFCIAYGLLKLLTLIKYIIVEEIVFEIPVTRKKYPYIISVFVVLAGVVVGVSVLNREVSLMFDFLYVLSAFIIFKTDKSSIVKAFAGSWCIIQIVDSIIYTVIAKILGLNILYVTEFENAEIELWYALPSFVVCLIILFVKRRYPGKTIIDVRQSGYYVFIISLIVVTLQVAAITYFIGSEAYKNADNGELISWFLMSCSAVSIIFIMLYSYKNERLRRMQDQEFLLLEKENEINKKYYVELYERNEAVDKYRHDIRHLIRLSKEMIVNHDYDKAVGILDDASNGLCQVTSRVIYSGNVIIDAVINGILGNDIRQGRLTFEYRGHVPEQIGIEDVDLCSLVSNALENSYFAVLKIESERDRIIKMTVGMSKNIIVINIENTMNIQAKAQENGKTDNAVHGFGIPNMKNIVDKYHGEYRSLQAEGVYSVEMIMEMSSNTKKEV